jgi:hypothetical protein
MRTYVVRPPAGGFHHEIQRVSAIARCLGKLRFNWISSERRLGIAIFGVNHVPRWGLVPKIGVAGSPGLDCKCVGGCMESWFAILPDWRLAVVWLTAIVLGTMIHFSPIARLLDSLTQ